MIDPELKYCPKCGDEYLSHIEMCAACEITLITGSEKLEQENARQELLESRQGQITTKDKLVTIQGGPLPNMKHFEKLLASARIGTLMVGEGKSCKGGCCPSTFRLLVREEDAYDAMEILNQDHDKTTALEQHDTNLDDAIFNPNAAETTCPACGHTFTATSDMTCPDCGLCFG
ncbi:MAG: hypothetical protein KAR13_02915 [Desulfobulbaceae bacterium]|nr:hypothetical protein [Desulfobulbaceae bacterium]MCK5436553.1 hypothetical protein [Desulfobulbaceae bacterium]